MLSQHRTVSKNATTATTVAIHIAIQYALATIVIPADVNTGHNPLSERHAKMIQAVIVGTQTSHMTRSNLVFGKLPDGTRNAIRLRSDMNRTQVQ